MDYISYINNFPVHIISKKYAQLHIQALVAMVNLIPETPRCTEMDVLVEEKEGRQYLGKWEHSLVVEENTQPIALITGYERKSEKNEQYPIDTLYIHELVVRRDMQGKGIGKKLLKIFLTYNQKVGFLYLSGEVNFSVQTNSAKWNFSVQQLYESIGFSTRSLKQYQNRVDIVYGLTMEKS